MRANRAPRCVSGSFDPRSGRPNSRLRRTERAEDGFTLIELVIVVAIMPLIVGALSLGLISVFSLQGGVANRLADTGDSQVIAANYENDVQGAAQLTTFPGVSNQCGSGTGVLLLGLESNEATNGDYLTKISYVTVSVGSGSSATESLERLYCTNDSLTPTSTSYLAYDLPNPALYPNSPQPSFTVLCVSGETCSGYSGGWTSTSAIGQVSFMITEAKTNYQYTLVSSPIAATTVPNLGSPSSSNTSTSCNFASAGTGTYSSTLCFVDFSVLASQPAALQEATSAGGCLEMSASLPGGYVLYFCLNLSGSSVAPHVLPTYSAAFLGNNNDTTPFYTGINGKPALYQTAAGTTYATFTNISVVSPSGLLATGWEAVSADAESTDVGESITWTTNEGTNSPNYTPPALYTIPNNQQPTDTTDNSIVGNACGQGAGLTGNNTNTVECNGGQNTTSGEKTGTAMVYAVSPSYMKVTMVGTGLEAITFGLMLS